MSDETSWFYHLFLRILYLVALFFFLSQRYEFYTLETWTISRLLLMKGISLSIVYFHIVDYCDPFSLFHEANIHFANIVIVENGIVPKILRQNFFLSCLPWKQSMPPFCEEHKLCWRLNSHKFWNATCCIWRSSKSSCELAAGTKERWMCVDEKWKWRAYGIDHVPCRIRK